MVAATFTQSSVQDMLRTATSIPCSFNNEIGFSMTGQYSSMKSTNGAWPSQALTTGQRKKFRKSAR
uniref:Uncharacterized protein n=1 Tax=Escherichia coli TaxID=562 RepID=A0A891ZWY5_ECOLX|nr:hypothetical protein [Escherichia coli]